MPLQPVILQIIPALETGGAERTVIEVAEAVVQAGGRAIVASEGGRLETELTRVGGEPIRFPAATKNPLTLLANARALSRLIAAHGVSLVHARSRAPAWSALLSIRQTGVPFVTTYHGIYNQKGRLKSGYNSVMARGDRVIANSRYTAEVVKARHGTPDHRLRIIPRGVDLGRFSPEGISAERIEALRARWGVSASARLVVLAARLTRWKGQHVAIGAAARVLQRPEFGDVVFVLAGDDQGRLGYREELAARIAELGLSDRILLPGHCEDIPAAFATADLALATSIEPEAFGRNSIEAQAAGCPVIVSEIGALPETISAQAGEHQTGWTFPAGDDQALAARIIAALGMPPERANAMSKAARRHVAALFSKQALQRSTLEVYDDLLGSKLASAFGRKSAPAEEFAQWSARIPL